MTTFYLHQHFFSSFHYIYDTFAFHFTRCAKKKRKIKEIFNELEMKVTMNYGSSLGNLHLIQWFRWFRLYEAIAYCLQPILSVGCQALIFQPHTFSVRQFNRNELKPNRPFSNMKPKSFTIVQHNKHCIYRHGVRCTYTIHGKEFRMSLTTSFVKFLLCAQVAGFLNEKHNKSKV